MRKIQKAALIGGLVLMAITVSAVIVDYISNQTTVSMAVESPLLLELSDNGIDWYLNLDLGTFYGGETAEYLNRATNRANVDILGNFKNVISNNLGNVDCVDFQDILVDDVSVSCLDDGATSTFYVSSGTVTIPASDHRDFNIKLVFAQNVQSDTYHVLGQIMQ